jgi:hypothetical protein
MPLLYGHSFVPPTSPAMLLSGLVVLLAGLLSARNAFGSNPPAIVDTGYAKYLGNRAYDNTVAYLGIPYAEPPLGERRFRAPVPLNTTRVAQEVKGKVVDATKYPDFCVQGKTSGTSSC